MASVRRAVAAQISDERFSKARAKIPGCLVYSFYSGLLRVCLNVVSQRREAGIFAKLALAVEGVFAFLSVRPSVRDREEGVPAQDGLDVDIVKTALYLAAKIRGILNVKQGQPFV